MSTTLFFLVPIGMLAVVWSLCFVGCLSSDQRTSRPALQQYHSRRTKPCRLLAAERFPKFAAAGGGAGAAAAAPGQHQRWHRPRSFRKNHNGTYINPPAYMAGATIPQIGTNPTLNLHQASIVPGDAFAAGSKNLPACVDFEGGYVSIPWAANSPSLTDSHSKPGSSPNGP